MRDFPVVTVALVACTLIVLHRLTSRGRGPARAADRRHAVAPSPLRNPPPVAPTAPRPYGEISEPIYAKNDTVAIAMLLVQTRLSMPRKSER